MITPPLSARLYVDGTEGVLRVDGIRRDTFIQLARTWREDGGRADIIAVLDELAEVVAGDPTEHELDAAIDALDVAGCPEYPEVRISKEQAGRLRRELGRVVHRLTARPRLVDRRARRPLAKVTAQRDGRDAA